MIYRKEVIKEFEHTFGRVVERYSNDSDVKKLNMLYKDIKRRFKRKERYWNNRDIELQITKTNKEIRKLKKMKSENPNQMELKLGGKK